MSPKKKPTVDSQGCEICRKMEDDENMLLCDRCDLGFHIYCLNEPLKKIPEGEWYCDMCKTIQVAPNARLVTPKILAENVVGLVNIGNSCFLNSTLQCLSRVEELRQSFITFRPPPNKWEGKGKEEKSEGNSAEKRHSEIVLAISDILTKTAAKSKVEIEDLCRLKEASGKLLALKYYTSDQQDMNEYLMQLLDHFNSVQLSGAAAGAIASVKDEQQEKFWEEHLSQNPSIVSHLFDGLFERSRKCPEGHKVSSFEVFRVVQIPFPPKDALPSVDTLYGLLKRFAAEEEIECRCEKCGGEENKKFVQSSRIVRWPKVFVLNFSRFGSGTVKDNTWWSNKIKKNVTFPVNDLNLNIVFPPQGEQESLIPLYNLFAVVVSFTLFFLCLVLSTKNNFLLKRTTLEPTLMQDITLRMQRRNLEFGTDSMTTK